METKPQQARITQDQYEGHDCHASPDDGCKTCEIYFSQPELTREDMIQAQANMPHPMFAPRDGICYYCKRDCVNERWLTEHITGCSRCGKSFCD
jgi:hypothetical protein